MDLIEMPGAPFRRHPWETARSNFFRRVLRDEGVFGKPKAVLDVGAGEGFLARQVLADLPSGSAVACFDALYGDDDLRQLGKDAPAELAFYRDRPAGRFDLLLLLDVVEHVPDDLSFLESFVSHNLAPGAAVLVSVPAWPMLFSRHDVALKHYRRYRPVGFRRLLSEAGLSILRGGGLFHAPLVPRALSVACERLLGRIGWNVPPSTGIGTWRGSRSLSFLLERALALDNAVSRATARLSPGLPSLPGLSYWALCRARADPRSEISA